MNFQFQSQTGGFLTGNGTENGGYDNKDGTTDCCIPVTVKQIHTASSLVEEDDDSIKFDNICPGKITFVGLIRNVNESSTHVDYEIEDSTGSISVRDWIAEAIDGDETETEKRSLLREGAYVRVFTKMSRFQGKPSLRSFHMTPVKDFNEITFHMLEVVHTHLLNSGKGGKSGMVSNAPVVLNNGGNGNQNAQQGMNQNSYNNNSSSNFEQPIHGEVLKAIMQCTSQMGLSTDCIESTLNNKYNSVEIRTAIEWLSDEGHIYSTVDDNHFKALDED